MEKQNLIIYKTADGKDYNVRYYAFPMSLAVGFRVRSIRGTQFRQWANRHLPVGGVRRDLGPRPTHVTAIRDRGRIANFPDRLVYFPPMPV